MVLSLACIISSAHANPAFANRKRMASTKVNAEKESKEAKESNESSNANDSSRFNRRKYNASVLAEIASLDILVFGMGARAAYIYSPKLTFEGSYLEGEFAFFGLSKEIALLSTRAKWFFGNSFYGVGGVGYRQVTMRDTRSQYDNNTYLAKSHLIYQNTAITAEGGIGNQWQFSGFTLGCDWVGLSIPTVYLSEDRDSTLTDSRGLTPAQEELIAEKEDDTHKGLAESATGVTLQLLRFYLGWSF